MTLKIERMFRSYQNHTPYYRYLFLQFCFQKKHTTQYPRRTVKAFIYTDMQDLR